MAVVQHSPLSMFLIRTEHSTTLLSALNCSMSKVTRRALSCSRLQPNKSAYAVDMNLKSGCNGKEKSGRRDNSDLDVTEGVSQIPRCQDQMEQ